MGLGDGISLYIVYGGPKRRDLLPFQHMFFIDALKLDIQPTDGGTCGRFLWLRAGHRAHNLCPKSSARSESHGHSRRTGKCSLAVCPEKKKGETSIMHN